jgi:pyruvate dehydrogenase E2 component (dihydrolipoamide acetyltransferase)
MAEFLLPKLGADMTEGRLVQWLKAPGEPIERGEVIAIIETDKANVDVESFVAGVFERALIEPSDEWLPVGTPLAVIAEGARATAAAPAVPPAATLAAPSAAAAPSPAIPAPAAVAVGAPAPRAPAPPVSSGPLAPSAPLTPRVGIAPAPAAQAAEAERLRISPVARKRAGELGVDASRLHGSGPLGRITLEDVETAARQPAPPTAPPVPGARAAAPTTPALDKRARMREAIAAAMARSKREIPHYYLGTTVDLAPAIAWLTEENTTRSVVDRLILGVVFLKAVARALREVPELNGFHIDGRFRAGDGIHVGTAISLRGGGLVAPALLDTDKRSLTELMHAYQDLVQRARAGSLRGAEMTAPTITVTSLGERGVDTVYGVIYPPQVALVGFGKVRERPWVVDGRVVARPLVEASLSADHRASDGHRGGLFLDAIARLLQEPEKL